MNKLMREGFVEDEPVPDSDTPIESPVSDDEEIWPIKVRLLHRPIVWKDTKGEHEVRELSFREPTGSDINRVGTPCRVNSEGDIIIDERKMTAIMVALSGIMTPHLLTMDPRDWASCAYRLRNFFLPNPDAWL